MPSIPTMPWNSIPNRSKSMNMNTSSSGSSSSSKKAAERRRSSDANEGRRKRRNPHLSSSFRFVPPSSTALLDTSDRNSGDGDGDMIRTSMIVMDRRPTAQAGGGAEGDDSNEDNQSQHQQHRQLAASLVAARSLSHYDRTHNRSSSTLDRLDRLSHSLSQGAAIHIDASANAPMMPSDSTHTGGGTATAPAPGGGSRGGESNFDDCASFDSVVSQLYQVVIDSNTTNAISHHHNHHSHSHHSSTVGNNNSGYATPRSEEVVLEDDDVPIHFNSNTTAAKNDRPPHWTANVDELSVSMISVLSGGVDCCRRKQRRRRRRGGKDYCGGASDDDDDDDEDSGSESDGGGGGEKGGRKRKRRYPCSRRTTAILIAVASFTVVSAMLHCIFMMDSNKGWGWSAFGAFGDTHDRPKLRRDTAVMNVQESALMTKPFYHEGEQAVGPSPTPMLSSTAAIESSNHGTIRTPLHVLSPQEQQAVLEQNHEAYKQWQMHNHPQTVQNEYPKGGEGAGEGPSRSTAAAWQPQQQPLPLQYQHHQGHAQHQQQHQEQYNDNEAMMANNHKEEAPMQYNQDVMEYNQQLVRERKQRQKEAMERYYQQLVLQTNQQTSQSTRGRG